MNLKDVMEQENVHLQRLASLVQEAIDEEQLLSNRLLEIERDTDLSFGDRLADRVAEFGGSWLFIIGFFTVFLVWIGINVWLLGDGQFDPYPFILLNLVLSCIAAIQAPIIMMSQNRREDKDRRRARGDFMINMKGEMEVRNLNGKLDLLISEQMQSLFKVQQSQLELLFKIEESVNKKI